MDSNAFVSLGSIVLPSPCKMLSTSCCPDKDLVALITRLGNQDRLSLWNVSGTKVWEVDVTPPDNVNEEIVDLDWSPDGQSIAVAHDPPLITLHSIQDGHEERSLRLASSSESNCRLTALSWYPAKTEEKRSSIPDTFRRKGIITGSAHSTLRMLPLLDALQDDSQKMSATDLFAFQGSHTKSTKKNTLPDVIKNWSTLPTDPLEASIATSYYGHEQPPSDEVDDSNVDSILAAIDNLGTLYCFLDGAYSIGTIRISATKSRETVWLGTYVKNPSLHAHSELPLTSLRTAIVRVPLLEVRSVRDMARLSSSARELLWYSLRVVRDMKTAWFGSDHGGGAREWGPKWIKALEETQRVQFGQTNASPILEMTLLLLAGRAREALADMLESGEQISERGLQKWESSVVDALTKIRDYSEKRLGPACKRLYLILEELVGWALLPQFALFHLSRERLVYCLEFTKTNIVLCAWLTATARQELIRFKEFMLWIRYEISHASQPSESIAAPTIKHDIIKVGEYLATGLAQSKIDRWFEGPLPAYSTDIIMDPESLAAQGLDAAIASAEAALKAPQDPEDIDSSYDRFESLNRNIDSLTQEIAERCFLVFDKAGKAASRSASLGRADCSSADDGEQEAIEGFFSRDRAQTKDGTFIQYVLSYVPSTTGTKYSILCLTRQSYVANEWGAVGATVMECILEDDENDLEMELLTADFFDDDFLVVVYRLPSKEGQMFIGLTTHYRSLNYEFLPASKSTREGFAEGVVHHLKAQTITSVRLPIDRSRAILNRSKSGNVSLAMNERAGRRIACLVDELGTTMETIDLEGISDEMEGEADESTTT